jgi:hypothetical protein
MTDLKIAPGEGVARPFHVGAEYPSEFMRRKGAGEYLLAKYGFGAASTLKTLASVGGGPEFHKRGNVVLYTQQSLDEWARAKISGPMRSASDMRAA